MHVAAAPSRGKLSAPPGSLLVAVGASNTNGTPLCLVAMCTAHAVRIHACRHTKMLTRFSSFVCAEAVHTYNDIRSWQRDRTRVLITIEEEDKPAVQIYLQALPEACKEACALLTDYDAVFPKKRKVKRQLRTAGSQPTA